MKYGYAVSDNDVSVQLMALKEFGCDEISEGESVSSVIKGLNQGDVIVVWRLDKLAHSVAALRKVLDDIHNAGATVQLLHEQLNSGSDHKELFCKVVSAMADLESR